MIETDQFAEASDIPLDRLISAEARSSQEEAIGEARDTIEDVLEPYLIQQGFLQRTPRGRIATPAIYRHLGLGAPQNSPQQVLGLD